MGSRASYLTSSLPHSPQLKNGKMLRALPPINERDNDSPSLGHGRLSPVLGWAWVRGCLCPCKWLLTHIPVPNPNKTHWFWGYLYIDLLQAPYLGYIDVSVCERQSVYEEVCLGKAEHWHKYLVIVFTEKYASREETPTRVLLCASFFSLLLFLPGSAVVTDMISVQMPQMPCNLQIMITFSRVDMMREEVSSLSSFLSSSQMWSIGLNRQHHGYEHWLLLQRTYIGFPGPT